MKNEKNDLVLTVDQQKAQLVKEILIRHIFHRHSPTLNQLASEVNMNRRKVEEIFEQRYGQSIYRYFLDIKMKRILRYVRENKMSLKEVSEKFEYSDQSALTVAFKRKFGISPSSFRERVKYGIQKVPM
jgi:AraC-like DNA-binding protein